MKTLLNINTRVQRVKLSCNYVRKKKWKVCRIKNDLDKRERRFKEERKKVYEERNAR